MNEYFPKPNSLEANVKVELDLTNYPTKADLKNATGIDTSDFPKKPNLGSLKYDVDKLDIDKLKNVPSGLSSLKSKVDKLHVGKLEITPVDLSNLSDVVKNEVVTKIKDIEDKITDVTNLTTNTTLNARINEVKDEISSITNLATTTALTAVENKIPNVSNLVKKADYDAKISKMEKNYFTTSDYNKVTSNILD